jgi:ubiquitin-conjugating enzyme E2 Q
MEQIHQDHAETLKNEEERISSSIPIFIPSSASNDSSGSLPQEIPSFLPRSDMVTLPSSSTKSLVSEHEDGNEDDDDEDYDDNDEEDEEYEYEDEDDTAFAGFLDPIRPQQQPARIEDDASQQQQQQQQQLNTMALSLTTKPGGYKEPSQAAVRMSLRAERETSGGKRRLASDLYKIMIRDTEEAGFRLEPSSPDSMDRWTIRLFQFDEDSNLHKDMLVLGLDHVELEMSFPEQYPFEPPFVRVVRPKFKKQTGFVMNGALCMELLTRDGWNPINDIESVIVSIRSLLVVGDGRLQAAVDMPAAQRTKLLETASQMKKKRSRCDDSESTEDKEGIPLPKISKVKAGSYTMAEAKSAYSHLSDYHNKKGWDNSGWWQKKG